VDEGDGAGADGRIDYATDLFEPATMARFVKQLRRLLTSVCEDPSQSIARISILPDAERRAIRAVNETGADYPREAGVHQLLERRALEHPERTAIVFEGTGMTYGELDERAGRLGRRLRELGVGGDTLVGLFVGRTPAMLVAMLAVLKAGGAYVPLDPAFPADRLAFMVKDSGLRVVVTEHSARGRDAAHDGHVLFLDDAQSYAAEALPMASEPSQMRSHT